MALDPTSLGSALAAVFASMPASKADAALAIANAYRSYAQTGTFGASLPTLVDALRDAMRDALVAGLTVPGAPPTIAAAWANSVNVFWAVVPVAGGSGVGTTSGCPGASSLIGALSGVFANLANTPTDCGNNCASALHTATLTVIATLTPPGGAPTPTAIS